MAITLPQIRPEFHNEFGQIDINTEFNEGLAYELEKILKSMFDYFKYRKVVLRLNSNGGKLLALTYITDGINQWRTKGREIHTEATFNAASAGALLLSLGYVGTRTVGRETMLLYHHSRVVENEHSLTANEAKMLAARMKIIDSKLIAGLLAHIIKGYCGVTEALNEGIARCELVNTNATAIAAEMEPTPSTFQKWMPVVQKMYTDCRKDATTVPYQNYLKKRFALDTSMDPREAYCLNLIDRVSLVLSLFQNAHLAQIEAQIKLCDLPPQVNGFPRVKAV